MLLSSKKIGKKVVNFMMIFVIRETYTFGTQFVVINISYLLSTPIAAYVFLPVFYEMQSASVYG